MPPMSVRGALYFLSQQQRKVMHVDIITFQPELRPALPCVFASKDYREFRETLVEMDRILSVSGTENRFIARQIKELEERGRKRLSARRAQCHGGILDQLPQALYQAHERIIVPIKRKFSASTIPTPASSYGARPMRKPSSATASTLPNRPTVSSSTGTLCKASRPPKASSSRQPRTDLQILWKSRKLHRRPRFRQRKRPNRPRRTRYHQRHLPALCAHAPGKARRRRLLPTSKTPRGHRRANRNLQKRLPRFIASKQRFWPSQDRDRMVHPRPQPLEARHHIRAETRGHRSRTRSGGITHPKPALLKHRSASGSTAFRKMKPIYAMQA